MLNKVKFENRQGESLSGVIHVPDTGSVKACALFAHCFTCTKNIKAAVNIAEALSGEGIAVLRFDFAGLGESEGDFSETHFSSNVDDLVDAAQWLSREHEAVRILVGHSLGGTAVLAAAHQIDSAVAVATIAAPAEAEHVLHLLGDNISEIDSRGEADVQLAGRSFKIRKEFLDDVRNQSVRDGVRSLRKALLVMHSPVDELVNIEEAGRLYASALHPKSYISLDNADHLLTREADSHYAGVVLAAWATHYLNLPQTGDYPAHNPDTVTATADTADVYLTRMNVSGHPMLADEPDSYGGTDQGPSPYDYLSAALGSCTAMTLNMYARHKQLPLESVTVETRHNKIHAKDCENCETETGQIDQFDRVIRIVGDLDAAQRERMLHMADRCPVHRTLHNEVSILSRLE